MWIILTLISSIFDSLGDYLNKKSAGKIPDQVFIWLISFCALPFFIIGSLVLNDFKPFNFDAKLVLTLIAGVIVVFCARYFLRKAYDKSDLSLVAPITGFTPIFSLILGFFLLFEKPSEFGFVGIFLVFIGSLISNFRTLQNFHFSLYKFFRTPGVYLTLAADFFYALYYIINKIGMDQVGISNWLILLHLGVIIAFSPMLLKQSKIKLNTIKLALPTMSLYGFFNACSTALMLIVLNSTLTVYYTALSQVYILINVFVGHFLFSEKHFLNRFVGSSVILTGLLIIGVLG